MQRGQQTAHTHARAPLKVKQANANANSLQPIGAKQFVNGSFASDFADVVSCLQNPCQAKLANLRPATDYQFWLSAVHAQRLHLHLAEDAAATSSETK